MQRDMNKTDIKPVDDQVYCGFFFECEVVGHILTHKKVCSICQEVEKASDYFFFLPWPPVSIHLASYDYLCRCVRRIGTGKLISSTSRYGMG